MRKNIKESTLQKETKLCLKQKILAQFIEIKKKQIKVNNTKALNEEKKKERNEF